MVIRGTGRRRTRLLFRTNLRKTLKTNLQVELLRKGHNRLQDGGRGQDREHWRLERD